MGVDAHELDDPPGIEGGKAPHRFGCRTGGQPETEFRIVLAGLDELVGVDLDPGGDPGQHLGTARGRGHQALEPVDLVERVDDDAAHAHLEGGGELGIGLVAPVQDQPIGRHPGGQGDMELATGRHVEAHPLFVGEPGHGHTQERFGGVRHTVPPRLDSLAAHGPEMCLVVDEQRRAELLGQAGQVDTADAQAAGRVDLGCHREQAAGDRTGGICDRGIRGNRTGPIDARRRFGGHIASGADTPSSPRPMDNPIRVPSTSHRRAWANPGSTSSARIGQSW